MLDTFQIIGGYDLRRSTSTIAARDAHAMVKATRKETKDISRATAESIAKEYGLELLGSKPRLVLMDGNVMISTNPYKLLCYKDVQLYCEQIHAQKKQAELDEMSNADIVADAIVARELLGV
jgi:hypothetical protein